MGWAESKAGVSQGISLTLAETAVKARPEPEMWLPVMPFSSLVVTPLT